MTPYILVEIYQLSGTLVSRTSILKAEAVSISEKLLGFCQITRLCIAEGGILLVLVDFLCAGIHAASQGIFVSVAQRG